MKFGVMLFPGSNCAEDCFHALDVILGKDTRYMWHKERDLGDVDAIIIPGGFSYGDYLRPGAIAHLSPAMTSVKEFARKGGMVVGICNGFQILTETRILPGSLCRNTGLKFICEDQILKVEHSHSSFTNAYADGELITCPIAHNEGNYYADDETIQELEEDNQVLFRYSNAAGTVDDSTNPNGSINNIAGIVNRTGNVLGMMPHPERSSDPRTGLTGGDRVFRSMINYLESR